MNMVLTNTEVVITSKLQELLQWCPFIALLGFHFPLNNELLVTISQ